MFLLIDFIPTTISEPEAPITNVQPQKKHKTTTKVGLNQVSSCKEILEP